MSLNKVLLIGYVGNDPDIHYYTSEKAVSNFRLALHKKAYRSATGHVVPERTDWIRIVAFGEQAQLAEEKVRKGTHLLVEGSLSTRTFTDKNNIAHNITEVLAERLTLL